MTEDMSDSLTHIEDIGVLLQLFEAERKAEDDRLRDLEHVRISPWNPNNTFRWDIERAEKRVKDLQMWCNTWWYRRGYRIKWNNDAVGFQLPSAHLELMVPSDV